VSELLSREWAVQEFGGVDLGDRRLNRRAVEVATAMASDPQASIPMQNKLWKATKGAYRLFDHPRATFEAMAGPHWQQTRQRAGQDGGVVLMIQDTTQLDYTSHPGTRGLGRFSNGPIWESGRGMLLHSVLAVRPPAGSGDAPQVLGLGWSKVWCRGKQLTAEQRKKRRNKFKKQGPRESQRWMQAVKAIGAGPEESLWVHVGDREADIFDLYEACTRLSTLGFAIRITLYSPWHRSRTATPLKLWAVRVWEVDAPRGVEPIEWIILTSIAIKDLADAQRVASWYTLRWMVEEYHKCLKTGCRVEQRQLESADRLKPLVAMLSVVAVRLLQLKQQSRTLPDAPALEHVPRPQVQTLVAYLRKQVDPKITAASLTVRRFTHEVAKLGGFIGRNSDGEPGWQTLWQGWRQLELMTLGHELNRRPGYG
jgi:hypothetical protein